MKARLELLHEGKVARVILAAPKANILDKPMVDALEAIFAQLESNRDLRAIVITADGPHFSFGASVEEHLPDEIEGALSRLGGLLRRVAAAPRRPRSLPPFVVNALAGGSSSFLDAT